ncbi:hypothetical protein TNCV_3604521 [Trichonephila clavipes]|nr:hypothetical protein TNCV_3604521 [Trichonephila clavipes]
MLWTKISVILYGRLPLQPEDLEQLSIVDCRANPYIRFMCKEYSYYRHMIPHDVLHLHSGLLKPLCKYNTSMPCCSMRKQYYNACMRALNNPHNTRPCAAQQRFTVNVGVSIVEDSLLGPYILPPRLDSERYLICFKRYFRNGLPMSPYLFGLTWGFNNTISLKKVCKPPFGPNISKQVD